MDNDVATFAQVMTVIIVSVAALLGIGISAWKFATSGRSKKNSAGRPALDDSRMERLEAAVDAIAIEVERISESQRFVVGILAERLPPRSNERVGELGAAGPSTRANTPH